MNFKVVGLLVFLLVHLSAARYFHFDAPDRIDEEAISEVYRDVRSDDSEISWAIFTYEGKNIIVDGTGTDYGQFQSHFRDDIRAYGFVRIETGDETKFVFVTWIGKSVAPLKKARVSTDKAYLKEIITSFNREILADDIDETNLDQLLK